MNAELQAQLANILNTLQHGAAAYAPKAWELAQQLKQIDSLASLAYGLLYLVIALALTWLTVRKVWPSFRAVSDGYEFDQQAAWIVALALAGTAALCFTIAGLINLLDIWTWVGLLHPDFAIAHDLLLKVSSQ